MSKINSVRETAINYIRGLSEKELIEFFYETVRVKNTYEITPTGYEKDRWCIAQTHYGSFESKDDSEHNSEFCALPDDKIKEDDWRYSSKTVHEQGKCNKCKALVICLSKNAKCPICDNSVSCT